MVTASPIDPKIAKVEDARVDPIVKLHKDIRIFGASTLVFLCLLSLLGWWLKTWMMWLWIPGVAIGLPALVYPPLMKPVFKGWMFVGAKLGWFVSVIALTVFYYIIITPVSLCMKLFGRDHLNLKSPHDAQSNWTEVPDSANDPKHFEHLF